MMIPWGNALKRLTDGSHGELSQEQWYASFEKSVGKEEQGDMPIASVEIRRAPRNEEWGARTFDIIDPFGNTLFFMGPIA